ncbi:MAG: Fe2+-dependent dioxygenase [Polaromonas sp.]|uniref:Fe2+-dependent dioxygenase n=1 Tax=Polaromonas sp. TaxID=1869339 RepID=UPI00248A4FC8|nr:Fe2+-dependent dioxygenase [Polaromonas sp.]MDI1238419.1 Fe2+-dependent dioxygenase [Polaromonas sp.]MDI1341683.1 Fe2+-dependent dioxygenase [Polaromonas sp.]
MLLRIPQALQPDELAQIRQLILAADWTDGRVTAGSQSASVKNNRQLPEALPAAQQARQMVSVALARNPMFVTGALPKSVYPPLFNRYGGESNYFGDHIDNAVRTHAASARHVRTDISCTLFLSDPASYDGGELVVQDTYGEQRIKFEAGDLVMYPGSSVHRVEPVTRGERLACFFWIESMVRQDAQRRLLYDMDMAITALRQKQLQQAADKPAGAAESPEVVRLTGCYHNLLRMWAEV